VPYPGQIVRIAVYGDVVGGGPTWGQAGGVLLSAATSGYASGAQGGMGAGIMGGLGALGLGIGTLQAGAAAGTLFGGAGAAGIL